jgi:hemolysin III
MIVLLRLTVGRSSLIELISISTFGACLILTYGSSTAYHSSSNPRVRSKLRILDHTSIYLLIAGTYTPLTLITLQGATGWTLFSVAWILALIGITIKLFYTGRFRLLSTSMYIFMGWIIVFAVRPLIDNLPLPGLMWLLAGGVSYTLGGVLYAISSLPFNHAAFHLLTLLGSVCHFVTVCYYVL